MAVGSISVGASARTDVTTSKGGTIAIAQKMKEAIYATANQTHCIRPEMLEVVTGARSSVASCLNTIGRNVACLRRLLADDLLGPPVVVSMVCASANPIAKKTCFLNNILERSHRKPSFPCFSRGWVCSTWLLAASFDSNLSEVHIIVPQVVYSGIRFKAIWAANKKLKQDER